MHIAFSDRTDYCQAHPSGIKTEKRDRLDRLGSDFFDFRLDFFWVDYVLVSDNGFAHPHDLISGAFQAKFVLTDRILLRLPELFLAWRLGAESLQFMADCSQGAL
jgi:hypothetical protein